MKIGGSVAEPPLFIGAGDLEHGLIRMMHLDGLQQREIPRCTMNHLIASVHEAESTFIASIALHTRDG